MAIFLAGIVVVDAAAPEQTGLVLPDVPLCVIDHHATDGWSPGLGTSLSNGMFAQPPKSSHITS